jgi:hypothetical protein
VRGFSGLAHMAALPATIGVSSRALQLATSSTSSSVPAADTSNEVRQPARLLTKTNTPCRTRE